MIIDFIRIILFFIILIGLRGLVSKIIKVPKEISLLTTIVLVSLVLYLFSIINLIKVSFILLYILGLLYFGYMLIKKELNINIKENLCFIFLIIVIVIISSWCHVTHFDNFSHWALIVKSILENGMLPDLNGYVTMGAYPPGTAIFISFFCFLVGNKESWMILAQNIIVLTLYKSVFDLIKCKNLEIKNIFMFLYFLFGICYVVAFNDLLVDGVMALTFIFGILLINKYKEKSLKVLIFLAPYMYLVKTASIFFIIILCIYYVVVTKKYKSIIFIIFSLIIAMVTWKISFHFRFKDILYFSRHDISLKYFIEVFNQKNRADTLLLIKNFMKQLVNFYFWKNIYLWLVNIVLIIMFLSAPNEEKNYYKNKWYKYNLLYIVYYISLGFMYVFSMPYNDAIIFSAYNRYISIILFILVGFVIYELLQGQFKKFVYFLVIFILAISYYVYFDNLQVFIGNDSYRGTIIEKVDIALRDANIDKNKKYFIYSPDTIVKTPEDQIIYFILKYRLDGAGYYLLNEPVDFEKEQDDYIIILDHEKDLEYLLDQGLYTKKNDYIFIKNS